MLLNADENAACTTRFQGSGLGLMYLYDISVMMVTIYWG